MTRLGTFFRGAVALTMLANLLPGAAFGQAKPGQATPAAKPTQGDKPDKLALPKDLPPFGPDRPLPVPQIVARTTSDGLTVWLVPRGGFPKVTAILAVRGGGAADQKGADGLAELLAGELTEGTKSRSAQKLAEELQAVGGELSARNSDDAIYLSGSALPGGTGKLVEIMADVARNAAYPDKEVALGKANATQGLLARESTPEFLAGKAFARAVFGDHPYRVVAPTKESLDAMTAAQLRTEHARRFRPERALLVITGEIDPEAVFGEVQKRFGGWKGVGESPAATPAGPAAAGRRVLVVNRPGSVQSQIVIGRPTVLVSHPDYYPLEVAMTICCGSFSSRLVKNIREDKGYTYSPRGGISDRERASVMRLRADVRSEVTAASLLEMFYELDRMAATNPTDEELQRAKRYLNGIYLLQNQRQAAVAGTLATNWVNGLPKEALAEFVQKVNAVTAEQVRSAARRYFPSLSQTVVVVGDRDKILGDLAPFGKVEETKP